MRTSADPIEERAFTSSGIVTLTTDFGLVDPYVGIVHGVILSRAPGARVVDLCHEIPPQDVARASFFLAHARGYFPPGTVHVAVVDPGVGSSRRLVVALDRGQAFLAPDNGLLAPVLSVDARVRALDTARFALPRQSRTFHGRDVLAPAAAAIAGGLDPLAAGVGPDLPLERSALPRARLDGDRGEAEVLFADRYGNLVLAARSEDLGDDPTSWIVETHGLILRVRGTYADVAPGEALALVDSYGSLEIAVRDGNAAQRLGLVRGDRVNLRRII
ncbi:MAG: SAM-dependent chlorinase/fluorinase [Planctomycetota bacterium]|nr:SAM-dependent chlorinase/fluorinase [Planctomycetota bacterium]